MARTREIALPRRVQPAPGPLLLSPRFVTRQPLVFLSAHSGRSDINQLPLLLDSAGPITPCANGLAYAFNGALTGVSAESVSLSPPCTFIGVLRVKTAVAWSAALYNRDRVNGGTLGGDGLTFYYVWDGSEWAYSTGFTFALNELVAYAYTVRPSSVSIALNGKLHVRSVSNSTRTFGGTVSIGGDPNGSRALKGEVYLAGVLPEGWSDDQLLAFSRNPWQIFAPAVRRAPMVASAPAAVPDITAVYAESILSDRVSYRATLNY